MNMRQQGATYFVFLVFGSVAHLVCHFLGLLFGPGFTQRIHEQAEMEYFKSES